MKSSISIRTLHATVFNENHATVDFHVKGDEARVSGTHFPRDTQAVRNERPRLEDFFSLAVGLEKDTVHLYLDRETLQGIAFTARELLDQAEGMQDGAESVRVKGLPIDNCDGCGRESLDCSIDPCDDVIADRGDAFCRCVGPGFCPHTLEGDKEIEREQG